MEYGEIPEYKLDYGYGDIIRPGDFIFRGSDSSPTPYLIERLVFEQGYGVRIITNIWSDCGLFVAASASKWVKERVKYLNHIKKDYVRYIEKLDKEIAILEGDAKR